MAINKKSKKETSRDKRFGAKALIRKNVRSGRKMKSTILFSDVKAVYEIMAYANNSNAIDLHSKFT